MPTPEETAQLAAAAKLAEEGQEKLNAAIDDYNQKLQKANDLKREGQTIEEAKLEKEQQITQTQERQNELRREAADLARELNEHASTMSEEAKQDNKDKILAKKELIELSKEETKALIGQSEALGAVLEDQKKYGKEVEKNIRTAEESSNEIGAVIARFASDIPVIGNQLAKVLNQKKNIATLGAQLSQMSGPAGLVGKALTGFANQINGGNIAVAAIIAASGKFALQLDNLSKEIGRATGLGDQFKDSILEGYKATMLSGVSMQEYGTAVSAVANGFSGFNLTSKKANETLTNTVARLDKLGVSAETSVKLMDHFHRAMNLSKEAAADMTAQLVMMGREVGITTSKMAANFEASSGIIARYGRDQMKVFKHLAAQVKATGLEMGTLLGMAEKFDQFDTAADSAAQLNAVLGTQLSTLELMSANESERIDMIKQQVQASVGNFDSLDKFTKMYVAQAMGLKDVSEAQRVLNMSMAERNSLAAKQKEEADIQAELAAATAELVPLMQRLGIILMKVFMIFEPVMKAFEGLFALFDWAYVGLVDLFGGLENLGNSMMFIKTVAITVGTGIAMFAQFLNPVGAAIMIVVSALGLLYDIIHKPGSKSIAGGLFLDIAKTIGIFAMMLNPATMMIGGLVGGLVMLWDSMHPEKEETQTFDVEAMASIDTTKVAAGFNKIKSAVMELSNIKMDGFLALSTSGEDTSFVMGSQAMETAMLISGGKLTVDVRIPKMEMPEFNIKVFLGGEEMKQIAKAEVEYAKANEG